MRGIRQEAIENYSGSKINLDGKVSYLRNGYVKVAEDKYVGGDAPKLFIHVYQYEKGISRFKSRPKSWTAYIAKVGQKWYPVESITEQIFTELGKLYGVNVADSCLALASGQLRFLSRYFLKKHQRLVHGAEIYASYLNNDILFVEQVEENKRASEFFTCKFTYEALKHTFPNHYQKLFADLIQMLTFDAICGNNDRHFYNWGVIESIDRSVSPYFAPIYDTARGLFWNYSERKLLNNLNHGVDNYCNRAKPKMGIEDCHGLNHFEFIAKVVQRFPDFALNVCVLLNKACNCDESLMLNTKFGYMLSKTRKQMIIECLNYRKKKLAKVLAI